jgi:hypothetical protein
MARVLLLLVGCVLVGVFVLPGVAAAQGGDGDGDGGGGGGGNGGGVAAPIGYDISYPQCRRTLPSSVLFGVVGVNDGIVYSANPCLGTGDGSSELAWAEHFDGSGGAILYANTADPGPALSSHWPTGQTDNGSFCDPTSRDSAACSYDYGWNAAANSYQDAVNAYIQIGELAPGSANTPRANQWWFDVESVNSWESNLANNVADLQGAVDYLHIAKGVPLTSIGIYANATDWATITGNSTAFAALPYWQPGAGSKSTAQSVCGKTGITGGAVVLSQYASNSFDADIRC